MAKVAASQSSMPAKSPSAYSFRLAIICSNATIRSSRAAIILFTPLLSSPRTAGCSFRDAIVELIALFVISSLRIVALTFSHCSSIVAIFCDTSPLPSPLGLSLTSQATSAKQVTNKIRNSFFITICIKMDYIVYTIMTIKKVWS